MVGSLERTDNENRSTVVTREPVYGPGHFASSQISLTTAAADESDTFDEYYLDIIPPVRISPAFFARLCGLQVFSNNSHAQVQVSLIRSIFRELQLVCTLC